MPGLTIWWKRIKSQNQIVQRKPQTNKKIHPKKKKKNSWIDPDGNLSRMFNARRNNSMKKGSNLRTKSWRQSTKKFIMPPKEKKKLIFVDSNGNLFRTFNARTNKFKHSQTFVGKKPKKESSTEMKNTLFYWRRWTLIQITQRLAGIESLYSIRLPQNDDQIEFRQKRGS